MATFPPSRLTRLEIRERGCRRAGNATLADEAVAWLSEILFELYTLHDWPFLHQSASLTITGPTFTLPDRFLQPVDDGGAEPTGPRQHALRVTTVDGVAQPLGVVLRDRASFEALAQDSTVAIPPTDWHADYATGTGLVHPNPTGHAIAAILRFKQLPAEPDDADEPTDIPVFPWGLYLERRIFVEALRHERDGRADMEEQKAETILAKIRQAAIPRGATSATLPLDPRVFTNPFRV